MTGGLTTSTSTLTIIVVMALTAALCRLIGYGFMRFVPLTPRIEAGLNALPLAVMIGIIGPPAMRGGVPELAAIVVLFGAAKLGVPDFPALLASMAVVATLRAAAF